MYAIGDHTFSEEVSDEIYDEYTVEGLEVVSSTDRHDMFLGVNVAKTSDIMYTDCEVVPFFPTIPDVVKEVAKKYNVEPKFYLVPYCSY